MGNCLQVISGKRCLVGHYDSITQPECPDAAVGVAQGVGKQASQGHSIWIDQCGGASSETLPATVSAFVCQSSVFRFADQHARPHSGLGSVPAVKGYADKKKWRENAICLMSMRPFGQNLLKIGFFRGYWVMGDIKVRKTSQFGHFFKIGAFAALNPSVKKPMVDYGI